MSELNWSCPSDKGKRPQLATRRPLLYLTQHPSSCPATTKAVCTSLTKNRLFPPSLLLDRLASIDDQCLACMQPPVNPRSSNTNQSIKAKTRIFETFFRPDIPKYCPDGNSCDKHEHLLEWIPESAGMEPYIFRDICLRILFHAQNIEGPSVPDREKTRISANGKLCSIEWEPFRMRV